MSIWSRMVSSVTPGTTRSSAGTRSGSRPAQLARGWFGSASRKRDVRALGSEHLARTRADVDLPTPPFEFAKTITGTLLSPVCG